MAHSLGNIAVSAAIQDHGLSVNKYLMLNAAVASEAFDSSLQDASPSNVKFVPSDWRDYPAETWSARWHAFFPDDDRGKLRWQDYFTGVLSETTVYNFYSSGDEVFELSDEVPGMLNHSVRLNWPVIDTTFPYIHFGDTIQITLPRHSWQKQEVLKGVNFVAGTTTGGWAFHCVYTNDAWEVAYSPAQATNLVATGMITNQPVFKRSPSEMFQTTIVPEKRNEIVAGAIPALSGAVGRTQFSELVMNSFDMDTDQYKNGWGRNHDTYKTRWLHSDIKIMAYVYVFRLFNELTEQGDLK